MRQITGLYILLFLLSICLIAGCGTNNADLTEEYNNYGIKSAKMGLWNEALMRWKRIVEMEPNKSMLWRFREGAGGWENATWSWGLYETNNGHTRLVSRLRQKCTYNSLFEVVHWIIIDPMEIFMMRTTLLGIRRRAESN